MTQLDPFSLTPLPREAYEQSARVVARRLLGHYLLKSTAEGFAGGIIVETEAYLQNDPACHAFGGLTNRTRTMFGPPGHAYVYLIYGFHYCVNAVCRPQGIGEAVLIRAIHPLFGLPGMQAARSRQDLEHLTSGPGKLCQALGITKSHDGADLTNSSSELWIAQNPDWNRTRRQTGGVQVTTRIGITKAAALPLRFYLRDNPCVSRK